MFLRSKIYNLIINWNNLRNNLYNKFNKCNECIVENIDTRK